jgi:DNA polymerase-3 subunit alpha
MNINIYELPNCLPDFELPKGYENADKYIKYLTAEGLEKRYKKEKQEGKTAWENIQKRAEYELDIIGKLNYTNIFLIVADYVNWAIEHNIPVGYGIGTSPSSIVSYALRINNICPIKYGLIFERFINIERLDIPYFGIEFSIEGQEKVINYVTDKYGKECVKKYIFYMSGVSQYYHVEHPSGIIIGKKSILEKVPLYKDTGNIDATTIKYTELGKYGLIRFDFFIDKTLDIIKHTEELIRQKKVEYSNFSVENICENDSNTFNIFKEGNTDNIYLFESDGIKIVLKQAKPDTMKDLIALNTLYRPELKAYIPQFVDMKNGVLDITYIIPELEEILKETYGVLIYQEQFMLIANKVAGYSLGQADNLRRKLIKSKIEDCDKEKICFIDNAVNRGFSKEKSEEVFELLLNCANIAFNKSHSVANTLLAYRAAYLKANFLKEYKEACNEYKEHDTMD